MVKLSLVEWHNCSNWHGTWDSFSAARDGTRGHNNWHVMGQTGTQQLQRHLTGTMSPICRDVTVCRVCRHTQQSSWWWQPPSCEAVVTVAVSPELRLSWRHPCVGPPCAGSATITLHMWLRDYSSHHTETSDSQSGLRLTTMMIHVRYS